MVCNYSSRFNQFVIMNQPAVCRSRKSLSQPQEGKVCWKVLWVPKYFIKWRKVRVHKKQVGSVGGALIQINGFSWPVTYIASANIMGSVFSSQALVLTANTARRKCFFSACRSWVVAVFPQCWSLVASHVVNYYPTAQAPPSNIIGLARVTILYPRVRELQPL